MLLRKQYFHFLLFNNFCCGLFCFRWNAVDVSKFLAMRAMNPERKLTVYRRPKASLEFPDSLPDYMYPFFSTLENSLHPKYETETEASVYSDGGRKHVSKLPKNKDEDPPTQQQDIEVLD